MGEPEIEVPDIHWILRESTQVCFFLPEDEALRVREALRDGIVEFVEFQDIGDQPCFVRAEAVTYLYRSTPAGRAMDDAVMHHLKSEKGFRDD